MDSVRPPRADERPRDAYRVVGTATRDAVQRAMPELTLTEAKVLLALIAIVASWSRLEDSVSNAQLQTATGMDERRVRRALRSLAARGVIELTPGDSPPGGKRRAAVIRFPTPVQIDPRSETPPVQKNPGAKARTDPRSNRPADPGAHRPPSEKSSEKLSESAIVQQAAEEIVNRTDWRNTKAVLDKYGPKLHDWHQRFPAAPADHLAQFIDGGPLLTRYVEEETRKVKELAS